MIAGDLIRQAQASGIELRLFGNRVKVIGQREALASMIKPLRQHREAIIHALQLELQEVWPTSLSAGPVDWRALDAAYLSHHFNCAICIAAGRSPRYGHRCETGMMLWRAYAGCSYLVPCSRASCFHLPPPLNLKETWR